MSLLMIMNYTLSMLIILFKNPLSKGCILLLLTISTSIMASTKHLNSWFGYILFLIMVGGILVTFIYMTSIASNEKFKFPKIQMMMLFILTIMVNLIIFSIVSTNNYFSMTMLLNQEITSISLMNKMLLTKIFNWPISQVPLALMSYLFLTLIMVVKMTDFIKGPIRQK
uniref:NADH-ubiquinone oxidoreductase chain 6 n=1 Tax=Scolytinae sp. BMNH 1274290 TaxID=2558038 RepID=A0A126TF56_9CUCU|nr:NADH dehydrogenase subunit 6 [Scolytinae sp. BMNH 1274290]